MVSDSTIIAASALVAGGCIGAACVLVAGFKPAADKTAESAVKLGDSSVAYRPAVQQAGQGLATLGRSAAEVSSWTLWDNLFGRAKATCSVGVQPLEGAGSS